MKKTRVLALAMCVGAIFALSSCVYKVPDETDPSGGSYGESAPLTRDEWESVFNSQFLENYTVEYGFEVSYVTLYGEFIEYQILSSDGGADGFVVKITNNKSSFEATKPFENPTVPFPPKQIFEGERGVAFKNGMAEMMFSFQDRYDDAIYNEDEGVYEIAFHETIFGPQTGMSTPIVIEGIKIKVLGARLAWFTWDKCEQDMSQVYEQEGAAVVYEDMLWTVSDIGTTVVL